jgi:hypothetical protein
MAHDQPFEGNASQRVLLLLEALISTKGQEQLSPRIPKALGLFAGPVRVLPAEAFLQRATFFWVTVLTTVQLTLTNISAIKLQIN